MINQPKPTPGPWFLKLEGSELDAYRQWKISAQPNHKHGPLRIATAPNNSSEDKANAVLMYAAPRLLEALKAAVKAHPFGVRIDGKWDDWRDLAETAINAAQGGND